MGTAGRRSHRARRPRDALACDGARPRDQPPALYLLPFTFFSQAATALKQASKQAPRVAAPTAASAAAPRAGVRRSVPAWKEGASDAGHTKPAEAPRGSLWERMFF